MSIPNEALQKLALEIESQASSAQKEINLVRTAIANKQREIRMLELTTTEITQLDKDTNVYEGVGKMFIYRPTSNVQKRLSSNIADLKTEVGALDKKLHYLETTYKNSREHIENIIRGGNTRP